MIDEARLNRQEQRMSALEDRLAEYETRRAALSIEAGVRTAVTLTLGDHEHRISELEAKQ